MIILWIVLILCFSSYIGWDKIYDCGIVLAELIPSTFKLLFVQATDELLNICLFWNRSLKVRKIDGATGRNIDGTAADTGLLFISFFTEFSVSVKPVNLTLLESSRVLSPELTHLKLLLAEKGLLTNNSCTF